MLRAEVEQTRAALDRARLAYQQQADLGEFDRISDTIGKELAADYPYLPEGYARAKLFELAMTDQALVSAFDNRASNPKAFAFALGRVRQQLRKEAASVPDPQLSEDKLAVVQAVRGASTHGTIAEPAPDLATMSDRDLREHTKTNFGF